MSLKSLSIKNFRNLQEVQLTLAPGLNVFEGANAQGKTNLLEAIYVLANGRSFRTSELQNLIQFEMPCAYLAGAFQHGELLSELKFQLSAEGKELQFQGKTHRSWKKVHEVFRVLVFTPDSTGLFRTRPSVRRQYFDQAIKVHYWNYGSLLSRYQRVLRQRNQLLEQRAPASLREPFDAQWAELSAQIMASRQEYLAELKPHWENRLKSLTQSYDSFSLRWEGRLSDLGDGSESAFQQALAETEAEEQRLGRTVLGPNREDLGAYFGDHPVREVASQGQQRLIIIALKLAEADLFYLKTGHGPVFLLDDIGSELDSNHLEHLLARLSELHAQTVLTSAQVGDFASLKAPTCQVEGGQVLILR